MHHVQITRSPSGAPIALVRRVTPKGVQYEDFYDYAAAFGFVLCRHDPDDEHYYMHLDREEAWRGVREVVTHMYGVLDDPEGLLAADMTTEEEVRSQTRMHTTVLVGAGAIHPRAHIHTILYDAQQDVMAMPSWRHDEEEDSFIVPLIPGVNDRRVVALIKRFGAGVVDPDGVLDGVQPLVTRLTDTPSDDPSSITRSSHEHRHESTVPGHTWFPHGTQEEGVSNPRPSQLTDPAW